MRLVTFDKPLFNTIQGEGTLVGVPSTFVRLYGCNQACAWCDTKGSWQAGPGGGIDVPIGAILHELKGLPLLEHVVITGGNPMLQGQEVDDLLSCSEFSERHTTIETNAFGGAYDPLHGAEANNVSILWSLSPKLEAWDEETVILYLMDTFRYATRSVQLKIVVQNRGDCAAALDLLTKLRMCVRESWDRLVYHGRLSVIFQPEYSMMKRGAVRAAMDAASCGLGSYFRIRVIAQTHKYMVIS